MSMWWKASDFCGLLRIDPTKVVKATAAYVHVACAGWRGDIEIVRRARRSDRKGYFETWDEAHAFLTHRVDMELHLARLKLQRAQARYGNVKGMKKPREAA